MKNIKCPDYDEFGDFIHQILVRYVDEYEPCKISDFRKQAKTMKVTFIITPFTTSDRLQALKS